MPAEMKQNMTTFDLCADLERFISDNAHSRDLDDRWLADKLKTILPAAREVRNNNLSSENRATVNAFRALEIEDELTRKRNEIDVLERDLKSVKAKAA